MNEATYKSACMNYNKKEVGRDLLARFSGESPHTCRKFLKERKLMIECPRKLVEERYGPPPVSGPTLVIGDTHCPFMHPRYVEFLQDTYKKYGCTSVIHVGDLVDHHSLSRHVSEPESYGAVSEFDLALAQVKELTDAFPVAKLCLGNHDTIVQRQAKELGIPSRIFLKPFKEVYELPLEWEADIKFIVDNVLYKHKPKGGKFGVLNSAVNEGMSTVAGHTHTNGGVLTSANHNRIIFGLSTGCGIDCDRYAFHYAKEMEQRPTLGCGVVFGSIDAKFEVMDISNKYRRKS